MRSVRGFFRRLDHLRRKKMRFVEAALYRWVNNDRELQPELLSSDEVVRILVLRNNKRIGNMFFLLPFIRGLKKAYPQAQIDLLLIAPWQGAVFEGMGLGTIFYSNFNYRQILSLPRVISSLRSVTYDIAFMPYGSSTDLIFMGLIQARNKVALGGDKYAFICPQMFERNHHYQHYAYQPIELLQQMGFRIELQDCEPELSFSELELERARIEFTELVGSGDKTVIGFFRGARGNKVIADQQWQQILAAFAKACPAEVVVIEILSPDIRSALQDEALSYQNGSIRALAAFLGHLDLFICGDTGPLHLAGAAKTCCVGLFTQTAPEIYGCLGRNSFSISDLQALDADGILRDAGIIPGQHRALGSPAS